MAVDYFIKIDGIPGESTDKQHKDEIEVISFSWGVTQAGTGPGGGGGGVGKASFQDVHFFARTSKALPQALPRVRERAAHRDRSPHLPQGGKAQLEVLEVKLSDVLVSSYQIGGSTPEQPLDQVSLSFTKFELKYVPAGKAGKAGPPIEAGWDLMANKKV